MNTRATERPTVGRVVHVYTPGPRASRIRAEGYQGPHAGLVIGVLPSTGAIRVAVFLDGGGELSESLSAQPLAMSLALEPGPREGGAAFWAWPRSPSSSAADPVWICACGFPNRVDGGEHGSERCGSCDALAPVEPPTFVPAGSQYSDPEEAIAAAYRKGWADGTEHERARTDPTHPLRLDRDRDSLPCPLCAGEPRHGCIRCGRAPLPRR